MKKIAIVDHSYKKKTRSIDFLKELLSKKYSVIDFFDESWNKGDHVPIDDLNHEDFSAILFFQILPNPSYVSRLRCKNIIWFPMYDAEIKDYRVLYYKQYKKLGIKVISFSKELYKQLSRVGFDCTYYKYQMKPHGEIKQNAKPKVFFWIRTSDVDWNALKKILPETNLNGMIIKVSPDPGQIVSLPTKEEVEKHEIVMIEKWLEKGEYQKLLSQGNIFIAPRKAEGIGLSFIEALANGMCILAHNDGTMNEYIQNNKNGILFDLKKKNTRLDLSNFRKMCFCAHQMALSDFEEWERNKQNLLEDIERPVSQRGLSLIPVESLWHVYYLIKRAFYLLKRVLPFFK